MPTEIPIRFVPLMTVGQRLLALEAAACACEHPGIPPNIHAALSLLQEELDAHFGAQDHCGDNWGKWLAAQRQAVKLLHDNPQVFGGEL